MKKTQKSFRKKALLSSMSMLLVATVAVGSATFAWFSQNTQATASGITAKTEQSSNIVLSESGTGDWTDKLIFTAPTAVVSTPLTPATTSDIDKTGGAEFLTTKAVGKDTGIMGAGQSLGATTPGTHYLKTTLYAKYEAAAGATGSQSVNLTLTATKTTGTEDFIRVALVPNEENAKTLTAKGIVYGNAKDDYSADPSAFTSLTAGTDKSIVTTTSTTLLSAASLEANKSYGFDVYVWYEGTDPQCIDSNAVNEIPIVFTFTKA